MNNFRLSRGLCAIVGEVLRGSHATLDALFVSSGAPGEPPGGSHASKWKEWLFRAGTDPETDSLLVLGNVLEEFMDKAPRETDPIANWWTDRERVVQGLEGDGLRYYRGGRVVPLDKPIEAVTLTPTRIGGLTNELRAVPERIDEVLIVLLKGLRRAMHPLTHRRKGSQSLSFGAEYDVQDLLHALLRPWVADIRPEEFTPSYAGTSTRMDFLLPKHRTVIELKLVRDRAHGKKIGEELIIDIEHYRRHSQCDSLWCVIYDPDHLLTNVAGLKNDLEGERSTVDGRVTVKLLVP